MSMESKPNAGTRQGSAATIPLSGPDIGDQERAAVLEVLDSGNLSLGPKVAEFEELVASFVGVRHAVAVNSGTSALHLCVKALGLGDGDEVITTPFSFIASANCLVYEGAIPRFVDIDPNTLNLHMGSVEAAIGKRTKGILPVHVFGLPAEMDTIKSLAHRYGLHVIEDACEALGAEYNGKRVGALAECGVFAFYPNKQVTTGEGGMIVTDNQQMAARCRMLRNQGRSDKDEWLVHEILGYNYRLSDVHCAIGIAQMRRVEELLASRERVAHLYSDSLRDVPGIALPIHVPGRVRSWFVYVVVLDREYSRAVRDDVLVRLRHRGVGCSNYFPPIHMQPFYRETFGYGPGDFPITESVADRTIALPFHGRLSQADVQYVAEVLLEELEEVGSTGGWRA